MGLINREVAGQTLVNTYYDAHTDQTHVERWQDVEPLLDKMKALRARRWDGYNADRSMKAIAEVPISLLEHWFHVDGISIANPDHDAEILKRLNDPVLRDFRYDTTTAGGGRIILSGLK